MTLVGVEALIDGVVRTLTDEVLPSVTTRFARGQLYAAVDVLRNLRDRIEPKAELFEAEAGSAAVALERVIASLERIAAPVAGALAAARAGPPAERAAALRAALVAALELIDGLPPERGDAARAAIREHLGAQALRDLAVLKPSLLTEISKG